jgi:uncharacterized protein (TIGR03437 family)
MNLSYVGSTVRICGILLAFILVASAETRPARWVVVLEDAPLARVSAASMGPARARIAKAQAALRSAAEQRGVRVVRGTSTLMNALFIAGTPEQAEALRALPGVLDVIRDFPAKRHLNRALDLVNAPAAWTAIGGQQNAGKGVKIGVLDSGIDNNHPAFKDPSLAMPSGFPKCAPQWCDAYTNSKVIVARSYVDAIALGFDGSGSADASRPDDLSPRDRVGHGTAVAMIAAGNTVQGPAATITGVAPKAYLGNYKVFGSPGVNESTYSDVIVHALEDALADGMDVVAVSLGLPALWTYTDQGTVCNKAADKPCDLWTSAVGNAAQHGLTIVVSAGNDGDLGKYPNLNSIATPGTAPDVITVGATTNSHLLYATARVVAADAPGALSSMNTLPGNGPALTSTLTGPVTDVSKLGGDGTACSPLANSALNGAIALIQLGGSCGVSTKVINAQKSGAIAVIFYRAEGDFVYRPAGLSQTGIPSVLIGNAAGTALKQYLGSHSGAQVSIDPALREVNDQANAGQITYFSAQGPAIGGLLIKPELVAPGLGIYTATQKYDPNGDMYDSTGFTVQQGTSFAAALVAGAAALVRQRFPQATPGQVKSMVVNTADGSNVIDFDADNNIVKPARVTAMGAGILNVAAVVKNTVTAEPATISFGEVKTGSLPSTGLKLTNLGTSSVTLSLSVSQRDADSKARVTLSPPSVTLAPGQSTTSPVKVQIEGSNPSPGSYEGAIVIKGGPVDLRVPYLYLVGDNIAANIYAIRGFDWVAETGAALEFDFKVVDKYGVPVSGQSYKWTPSSLVKQAGTTTDALGIGFAFVNIGTTVGEQSFRADAGNLTAYFDGRALATPRINSGGVVNAGSHVAGQGLAPGSYIEIKGSSLSPSTRVFNTPYLPVSLAGVSVSFDSPSSKLSLPGHLHFVSENQVNVQVPWELQGLTSVQMKVSIGDVQTALYTVTLADYSPAFFEFNDPGNGRLMVTALDETYKLVSSANPVQRGKVLQIFMNGLGPANNQPASGEPSSLAPAATTRTIPEITIGGQVASVAFSGLAPNLVGLYQVNVVVPAGIAAGAQPVTLTSNGVQAKASSVVVK